MILHCGSMTGSNLLNLPKILRNKCGVRESVIVRDVLHALRALITPPNFDLSFRATIFKHKVNETKLCIQKP